jgi:predicted lipid-binding transport protein (Tim44 family)
VEEMAKREEGAMLYIHRSGQQFGPYNQADVRAWLSSGQILPTDLACPAGSDSWVQVNSLPGMQVALAVQQQTGPSGSGWGLIFGGMSIAVIGLLLTATLIGAILGIPMFIAGIIMAIYGRVQYNRKIMYDLKESIRSGIVQGMAAPGTAALAPPNQPEQRQG